MEKNFEPAVSEEMSEFGKIFAKMIESFFNNPVFLNAVNCSKNLSNSMVSDKSILVIPEDIINSETGKIYYQPVFSKTGYTWEKDVYERKFGDQEFVPNLHLKNRIRVFLRDKDLIKYKTFLHPDYEINRKIVKRYVKDRCPINILTINSFTITDIMRVFGDIFYSEKTHYDVKMHILRNLETSAFSLFAFYQLVANDRDFDYPEILKIILEKNPNFFNNKIKELEREEFGDYFKVIARAFLNYPYGISTLPKNPYFCAIRKNNLEKLQYLNNIGYPLPYSYCNEEAVSSDIFPEAITYGDKDTISYVFSSRFACSCDKFTKDIYERIYSLEPQKAFEIYNLPPFKANMEKSIYALKYCDNIDKRDFYRFLIVNHFKS